MVGLITVHLELSMMRGKSPPSEHILKKTILSNMQQTPNTLHCDASPKVIILCPSMQASLLADNTNIYRYNIIYICNQFIMQNNFDTQTGELRALP